MTALRIVEIIQMYPAVCTTETCFVRFAATETSPHADTCLRRMASICTVETGFDRFAATLRHIPSSADRRMGIREQALRCALRELSLCNMPEFTLRNTWICEVFTVVSRSVHGRERSVPLP